MIGWNAGRPLFALRVGSGSVYQETRRDAQHRTSCDTQAGRKVVLPRVDWCSREDSQPRIIPVVRDECPNPRMLAGLVACRRQYGNMTVRHLFRATRASQLAAITWPFWQAGVIDNRSPVGAGLDGRDDGVEFWRADRGRSVVFYRPATAAAGPRDPGRDWSWPGRGLELARQSLADQSAFSGPALAVVVFVVQLDCNPSAATCHAQPFRSASGFLRTPADWDDRLHTSIPLVRWSSHYLEDESVDRIISFDSFHHVPMPLA